MNLQTLTAISPIDGRYRSKTEPLAPYFSEFGLIRYRVWVEVEYFLALTTLNIPALKSFPENKHKILRSIYIDFKIEDAEKIKEIEKITNHDVKAVEYFLREKFDGLGLNAYVEYIHFGLTSQDINNTAIPFSIKIALEQVIFKELNTISKSLGLLAEEHKHIAMLARTHGQAASPTRLGKEIMVFFERLNKQILLLENTSLYGKFGGATGNFNAHVVAFPHINWVNFANSFLFEAFGLQRNTFTTQIDHYDELAEILDTIQRINVILIDFCRDIWTYISMDYFKQKVNKDEVGSSAMPHKVNPIDFENAEGNLGIANAILGHLSRKLPISRLQRDLTDSTVLRNIGVPLAHALIAYESIKKGISKLIVNEEKINQDLEQNWAVVTEAIQTILRRENFPHPYEKLKQFSRGKTQLNKADFIEFINSLAIPDSTKEELLKITPFNYTGV